MRREQEQYPHPRHTVVPLRVRVPKFLLFVADALKALQGTVEFQAPPFRHGLSQGPAGLRPRSSSSHPRPDYYETRDVFPRLSSLSASSQRFLEPLPLFLDNIKDLVSALQFLYAPC